MLDAFAPPGMREDIIDMISVGLVFVAIVACLDLSLSDREGRPGTALGLLAAASCGFCLLAAQVETLSGHGPSPSCPTYLMLATAAYLPTARLRGALLTVRLLLVALLGFTLLAFASGGYTGYAHWWIVYLGAWGVFVGPILLAGAALHAEMRGEANGRSPRPSATPNTAFSAGPPSGGARPR